MEATDFSSVLGPTLTSALARKGYTELTAVQEAVLDPALSGRDLRITSQTGSGKTLAIGFALRALALEASPAQKGIARPRALVVAPTRELARQIEDELTWLYAGSAARLASATGGASYRDEHRALAAGPTVVVGTPGRLVDHLQRGAVDTSSVGAVVLDEADRMLDLGFRDELDAILDLLPEGHRTHLVSATFPKDVRALADRVQREAAHVEGTRLGAANADIAHVIHVVHPREKVSAIVNLLLSKPEAQTLVFARTRADVANIADELSAAGFGVTSLSGDMDQPARNRALTAFKRGSLRVLVATDVAARGIDVQDIACVLHVDVPTDADSYTHRSGRTGRAGRQGTSALLVSPSAMNQATRLLRFANVAYRVEPLPDAEAIRRAADDRLFDELTREEPEGAAPPDARALAVAARIAASESPERAIARLVAAARGAGPEPRDVRAVEPPRNAPPARRDRQRDGAREWVSFRVSWGGEHGADTRRLLAMACRRGGIAGKDVGAIRVERTFSLVDVATQVADSFEQEAGKADPRDPRVVIRRERAHAPAAKAGGGFRGKGPAPFARPQAKDGAAGEHARGSRDKRPDRRSVRH